jgi:quercetin dioxygenase-like cupin family protein
VQTVIRLARTYDADRLRRDLETALASAEFIANRPTYHDGGWKALALVAPVGKSGAAGLRFAGADATYAKTGLCARCPYFDEIIDGFGCPVQRVRLLRLEPGAKIHEHVDLGDGWAMGKVRVHIPIVTDERVEFYVDGRRIEMRPGELWYCDFTRRHRVHNASDVGRVHLVLDLVVDDWLRELFPREPLVERVVGWAQRARFDGEQRLREAARGLGLAALKKRLFGATSSTGARR